MKKNGSIDDNEHRYPVGSDWPRLCWASAPSCSALACDVSLDAWRSSFWKNSSRGRCSSAIFETSATKLH